MLDSIVPDEANARLIDLRDRALIAVMIFSFARISAVVGMRLEDYYPNGKRWWLRLHEKGGKFHEMPAHHHAEAYLDAYIHAAGLAEQPKAPLFRSIPARSGRVTDLPFDRRNAWDMVKRRAKAGGLTNRLCNHSFRGTGITAYLANGGDLKKAKEMAAHADVKITQLYDRTGDRITLDEAERITIQSLSFLSV